MTYFIKLYPELSNTQQQHVHRGQLQGLFSNEASEWTSTRGDLELCKQCFVLGLANRSLQLLCDSLLKFNIFTFKKHEVPRTPPHTFFQTSGWALADCTSQKTSSGQTRARAIDLQCTEVQTLYTGRHYFRTTTICYPGR